MKVDTSGIETGRLLRILDLEYALDFESIGFLPKGEEAYHYATGGGSGARYFVKLQRRSQARDFSGGLSVAVRLREACGLDGVLAPLRARDGRLSVAVDGFDLAVFPFLKGASGEETRLSDGELGDAAGLVAAVHSTTEQMMDAALPRSTFGVRYEAPIRRSLRAAAGLDPGTGGYRGRVRNLLLREQDAVMAELAAVHRLAGDAATLTAPMVLTHGDPNYANFVRDGGGRLHLVDWSEPGLGPRERDLFAFVEDRFDLALHCYLAVAGPVRLHTAIFAYYAHLWAVQEIADYTTRILFTNTDPAEDAHAWEALTPYLPVPVAALTRDIEGIDAVLRRAR